MSEPLQRSRPRGLSQHRSTATAVGGAAAGSVAAGAAVAVTPRGVLYVLGLAIAAVAVVVPVDLFLGATMFVRNLTEYSVTVGPNGDPTSGGASSLVGVLVIAVVPVRLWFVRNPVGIRIALVISALLIFWFGIGYYEYGNDPSLLRELARSLSVVAIGVLAANAVPGVSGRRLVWLVVVAGVLPAAVGLLQIAGILSLGGTAAGRARGTFSQSNSAATVFGICLTLSVWLTIVSHGRRRTIGMCLATLFALALVATASLGGIAGGVVSVLVLTSLLPVARRIGQIARVATVLLILVFVLSPVGAERVNDLASTQSLGLATQGVTSNSLDWRFYNWSLFYHYWEAHPVFGNGLGSTIEIINPIGRASHSDPIRLLVETGIVGVVTFGGLLLWLAARLWRRVKFGDPRTNVALPAIALLIGVIVRALDNTVSTNSAAMYMLAVVCGAAIVTTEKPRAR